MRRHVLISRALGALAALTLATACGSGEPAKPRAVIEPAPASTAPPASSADKTPMKQDEPASTKPPRPLDVHFVPTPHDVVDKMLELAAPKKGELLYDLGCGDGRIVIAAAKKYGVRAVGYDLDPTRVAQARANVEAAGVGDLVTIEQADVFTLDLSAANVITVYLLPKLNVRLIPQLEKLAPGSRVVSHDFDIQGMLPNEVVTVQITDPVDEEVRDHEVYFFTLPFEPDGSEEDDDE